MSTGQQIVRAVLAGGAMGSLARVGLMLLVRQVAEDAALGTLVVNVLGCFSFGLCWALHGGGWSKVVVAGLFAGCFGAFTTFSTFAFECLQLLERGRTMMFVLHLFAQNLLGGLAMLGGVSFGRLL